MVLQVVSKWLFDNFGYRTVFEEVLGDDDGAVIEERSNAFIIFLVIAVIALVLYFFLR